MLVYIIVGSVREGRTAIKIANWLETTIPSFNLKDFQTEVIGLKKNGIYLYFQVLTHLLQVFMINLNNKNGLIKLPRLMHLSLLAQNITTVIASFKKCTGLCW